MFPKSVTFYHKEFDKATREDVFHRYNVDGVHIEQTKALNIAGTKLQASDDVQVVIPLETVKESGLQLSKDDVMVVGRVEKDIESIHDLKGHDHYTVTTIHYIDYALIDYLNNWTVIAR